MRQIGHPLLRKLKVGQRGQESAGVRLLVEAVMVAFILLIIFVILARIDEIRQEVSERRLFDGFEKAVRSPDKSVILEENLVLSKGSAYSSRGFAEKVAGVKANCVKIEASDSAAFSLSDNSVIEINSLISTNVYYQCGRAYEANADCPILCTISFGKELRKTRGEAG